MFNQRSFKYSPYINRFLVIGLMINIQILILGCQKVVVEKPEEAILQFIIGEVNVNGQPAKINQIIKSNSIITTGANSVAEVRLGKHSGTQIRENGKVEIAAAESGWNVIAHRGSVLNLVNPGTRYKLRGPAAVIAVRGTIFYVNAYEDSTQYICTCNGKIDIIDNSNINKTVSASHHEGYTATLSDTGQSLESTPMKEHTDLEIFEFMYRIEHPSEIE